MATLRQVSLRDDHQIVTSLQWLCASADWIDIKPNWTEVYQLLRSLGFRPGDRLGELATMNPRAEVRWMAGQVMRAIESGSSTLVGMRSMLKLADYASEWLERNPQPVTT